MLLRRFHFLNFVEGPGVPLQNFEEGPGVPLLNFEGVPGPEYQGHRVLVSLLHHALDIGMDIRIRR